MSAPPAWKLQKPIVDVCNLKAANQPMLCENANYAPCLRQSTNQPIDGFTKQKLLTALCAAKQMCPDDSKHPTRDNLDNPKLAMLIGINTSTPGYTTIAQFNAKTNGQQCDFINEIWKRLVDYRIPNVVGSAMFEQDGPVTPAETPLPTSIAPANRDAADFVPVRRDLRATWGLFGIGFRVEGSKGDRDDLVRIVQKGPTALLHTRDLLRRIRGWVADDTYIEQRDRVFLWWQNEDVLNESASCVSRSLFGCTALPGRDTDTAKEEGKLQFHYIIAISCKNLMGCDTERWQLDRGAGANWRPGEKAFLLREGTDASKVIAWTKMVKQPPPGKGGGWRFMLPEARWNWLNVPDEAREAYLNAEIQAYRANHWYNVSGAYDFAK
jgi:hypothetical protein